MSRGDETALEEFVHCYQKRVLNLVYRYTLSRQDAEELAQDVFVKIWNKASSFKGMSKVSTWVFSIASHLAINHLKKKKLPAKSLDEHIFLQESEVKKEVPGPEELQPQSAIEKKSRDVLIESAIESLPPNQKIAFVLSKCEHHSYAEIAGIMNLSIPAIESLLFRAKQNLRTFLLPYKEKGEI